MTTQYNHFTNSTYPYHKKMGKKEYESEKAKLQVELLKMQKWVRSSGQKLILVFEGRDAAGKGGTIKRFTEHLNPRFARVIALNVPTTSERNQWYFQRYVQHFPTSGEIVLFDRSWYNRAGVERVMGFCTDEEHQQFMSTVAIIEEMWVDSGIRIYKYWFSVTKQEQAERFQKRADDPLKQWKLSDIDKSSIRLWDKYTQAKEALFHQTDTEKAPWIVVKSDDKKRARINCMRDLLTRLPYSNKNEELLQKPDPMIIHNVASVFGNE